MSVYVLIQGKYSDWAIKGYVKTAEEAEKICSEKNSHLGKYDYGKIWYYKEADEIYNVPRISVLYEHRFRFVKIKRDKWAMDNEAFNKYGLEKYVYKKYNRKELPKNKITCNRNKDYICIEIYQIDFDRQKAEKFSQEMLAQFLAEQEEI